MRLRGCGRRLRLARLPLGYSSRGTAHRRHVPPTLPARYAPEIDGEPDPGEVVWAWVPYEDDPTQGKDRPVLLLDTGRRATGGSG